MEALLLREELDSVTEEVLRVLRLLILELWIIVSLGCIGHDCDMVDLQHGLHCDLHTCKIGCLGLSGVPCLEKK